MSTFSTLKTLSDEEELVAGLAVFVRSRRLKEFPPKDNETLAQLGVPPGKLDTSIRSWINATFRQSNTPPLKLLKSGDLTVEMTWPNFKKAALT